MKSTKLVVITGCLGLIGSHVTRQCLALGWKVYGVDCCTYAANIQFLDEVSIGHAIISDAIYLGLENVIRMYKGLLS